MIHYWILAINPGSTSTKLAVFHNSDLLFSEKISHSAEELAPFKRVLDQYPLRKRVLLDFLKKNDFAMEKLSAVVGRGGLLTPMESGTYQVTPDMVEYLQGLLIEHASNLGAILAYETAQIIGKNAYIVDPIVVDEMEDVARITGIPEIRRRSIFHALNQKAAAREAAKIIGKKYEECRFIVAHMGGGISIGAHRFGRVIDVNNALNGDGPMSPERVGSVPTWSLVEWALSGKYTPEEIKKILTGKGGLMAHLKTNDLKEVEIMVRSGDPHATLIYSSMIYQIAKEIGAMAAVLEGQFDAVILTGGITFDEHFMTLLKSKIEFLGRIIVIPGEDEMRSLALGTLRILTGEEEAKIWHISGGKI